MKIVVTGCSGYIGTLLVDFLLTSTDVRIVGIDRDKPSRITESRFDFVRADLSCPDDRLEIDLFQNVDAVIHLAAARGDWAISPREYWRDNLASTEGLLAQSWASSVRKWIFMSSVSVYGPADRPLREDAVCAPVGAYGESKLASEVVFRNFIAEHRLAGRSIRPSAVFGPKHPPNTNVYKLIESLRGWAVPLIAGGGNRKTLTYLPNLLSLMMWCLNEMEVSPGSYATYNYVEEPVPTVSELISTLKDAGIQPSRRIPIPFHLALAASYPIYALARLSRVDLKVTPERVRKFVASTWYDSSLVRSSGFTPETSLDDALRETARWHMSAR
jgi:GlcNAc-P-P-Und epimerase